MRARRYPGPELTVFMKEDELAKFKQMKGKPAIIASGTVVRLAHGRAARVAALPFYDPLRRLPRGAPL